MVIEVQKHKLRVGIGTVGMAILFVSLALIFSQAFKALVAGETSQLFNVALFPSMIGFLLSGYCQLVTSSFSELVRISKETDDASLHTYLSAISIASRMPVLASLASILTTGFIANSYMNDIMLLSLTQTTMLCAAQALALMIIVTATKKPLFAIFKK